MTEELTQEQKVETGRIAGGILGTLLTLSALVAGIIIETYNITASHPYADLLFPILVLGLSAGPLCLLFLTNDLYKNKTE